MDEFKYMSKLDNKDGFGRNVATLMTGTTISQAALILASPLLTRLYDPVEFGLYASYLAMLSVLSIIACLRYELAIVLPKEDADAANLLAASVLSCILVVVVLSILVVSFALPLTSLLNLPDLAKWLWLMPLSLFATGLFQAFNYWSTRKKKFPRLAIRMITQNTITVVGQISLGVICPVGFIGLIGGTLCGQVVATGILGLRIIRDEGNFLLKTINCSSLLKVMSRYKKFPLISSWAGLFNTSSSLLPIVLLGYFFSPGVIGHYALANKVLSMPMGIVGDAISQAFFPRASEALRKGTLKDLTFTLFQQLFSIGYVPFLLFASIAPDLFVYVFGERWFISGQFARWMSPWLFLLLIVSPLSNIYFVLEKQQTGLLLNIVLFFSRLSVLYFGGLKGSENLVIVLFCAVSAIIYLFNCLYILSLAGISAKLIFIFCLKQIAQGVPYVLFPWVIWYVYLDSVLFILAGIGSGVIFLLFTGRRKNFLSMQ